MTASSGPACSVGRTTSDIRAGCAALRPGHPELRVAVDRRLLLIRRTALPRRRRISVAARREAVHLHRRGSAGSSPASSAGPATACSRGAALLGRRTDGRPEYCGVRRTPGRLDRRSGCATSPLASLGCFRVPRGVRALLTRVSRSRRVSTSAAAMIGCPTGSAMPSTTAADGCSSPGTRRTPAHR